ncbi:MAG: YceI family protein [Geminicoccaceae bacterium]|jgi:polyisoprenoid-binding protein YceI|nr:YceI family protein [Geminicoccaceae bacterium]HRY26356.1 YceI family protein [Geminicoccaceae bacterium]
MTEPSPLSSRRLTWRPAWLATALLAASPYAAAVAVAEPASWVIDPGNSSIGFAANHIGYKDVLGLFLEERGSFTFDEATLELSDLVFEVEAASVFTDNPARNEHLLSDDFLAAESHPLIRFVMTEALPATATTGTIKGDLTVRGVTRPAEVDVTLNRIAPYPWGSNYVMGVSAEAVVRRSAFGSTYALEGGLVADEIFLAFEIEAIRQD